MKLIMDSRRRRIYLADDGVTTHEVQAQVQGFYQTIERATYDSHDPADKARVETVYKFLRMQLAVAFTDRVELELIDTPQRRADPDIPNLEVEPGLKVPVIALIVEQAYWPPAPTEQGTES